ncbi:TPA: hypothetical protein QCX97_003503 [Bacillus wiedmannii]|uniref:hypothetical protein n=1 Tax=Bacillus wiedmannii TaxID=1890302 RepID=UPI000871CC37|nr:hypothetical protein [Bacillus wiedmannii]MDR4942954.1 hypothetical protein [Bacillus wiedmannii]OFC98596.1 hypothetical protein BTGOE6_52410 [Bacillus wiedmannii]HDR7669616.1 hypothetical protein [Bacillus wiedmannii]
MKLTLFTISNEQIKEQLSKLQTKVESLETVKDVQDKIISAKDSQISFLNDQIANIWTPITIVAGLIALVVTYVAWVNKKADEKVEKAKDLIDQNQKTATLAQEKLGKLENKQKELNALINVAITNQKIDISIREISIQLDSSNYLIDIIIAYHEKPSEISQKQEIKLSYLKERHASLLNEYRRLSSIFSADIAEERKIEDEITNGTNKLKTNSIRLYKDCEKLINELELIY